MVKRAEVKPSMSPTHRWRTGFSFGLEGNSHDKLKPLKQYPTHPSAGGTAVDNDTARTGRPLQAAIKARKMLMPNAQRKKQYLAIYRGCD
jgi:hypothetical protein